MSKIKTYLLSLVLLGSLLLPIFEPFSKVDAASTNLIPNADLSQVDPGTHQPVSWHTDNWGNNTPMFTFIPINGSTPAALKVDMANYSDGDAKWWFNPVTAVPGDNYQFSDVVQSNTVSNVWARFLDSQNNPTYQWLGNSPAYTDPHSVTFNFVAPSSAVSVTIFHVIDSNGFLQTNGFTLYDTSQAPCKPSFTGGLYNSSFEETCPDNPNIPAWWYQAVYGGASASFDYLNTGHNGTHSVDINFTGGSGEAGWYFKPVNTLANQRYQLTFWYKSTIYLYAYAEITLSDGSTVYQSLMSAPASGGVWTQYQDGFVTPANAKTITIHTATSDIGQVVLDTYVLRKMTNYPSNKFNRPLVTISFDDGWESSYKNGVPAVDAMGFKPTFYINGGNLGQSGYMTADQVKALSAKGYEIGSHAYYHDDLVSIPLSQAYSEITKNNTYLSSLIGMPITDFATPYGSYNQPILNKIMQYHQSHRDTSGLVNYKYNFNPRIVHSVLVTKGTTLSSLNNLLQTTKANGGWLVLTYHEIASGGDDYTITKSTLQSQLNAIKNSGLTVETVQQGLSEVTPQL
ncbi:MAG TPA: polysaccharide deacetylase family protein [Candidatus Saccharimonadales bacterium]|nr:polysaccharide deacetylase family protein [Candidatus Saccharimonadales bacterium]